MLAVKRDVSLIVLAVYGDPQLYRNAHSGCGRRKYKARRLVMANGLFLSVL